MTQSDIQKLNNEYGLLFSQKKNLADLVEEYCKAKEIPVNSFNAVTALNELGYLRVKPRKLEG